MDENDAATGAPQEPGGPIRAAGRFGRWIDRGGLIFAISIIVAMLILIQEVFLRYVFNSPTIWAHETTVFLSGITFIYGGLYCTARNSHIRVVLIYDALPHRVRRIFDVFISAISALASGTFAWAAWLMVERAAFRPDGSFYLERSGSAWNPVYPGLVKITLMVVLALLAVQFLILTVNHARGKR